MTEPVHPGAGADKELWATLSRLQTDLLDQVLEHEKLCLAATPDRTAITMCRWRGAQAGRVRMEHLQGRVFPCLLRMRDLPDGLRPLVDDTPAYRQRVSAYVLKWSTDAIFADWVSYQAASHAFRIDVRNRVAAEVRLIRPTLDVGRMTNRPQVVSPRAIAR